MDERSQGGDDGNKLIETDDVANTECGLGKWRPRWLQWCTSPKVALAWLCWFAFLQGVVVSGITNANTSTFEKRFGVTSSKVSLIHATNDFSAGLFSLPVTYFGTYAHHPRWLAIAALLFAVGTLVMGLPHFVMSVYEMGNPIADICSVAGNNTVCEDTLHHEQTTFYLLMFGMFISGIGVTTLYSLGIVFLDNHVGTQLSPRYTGIFYMSALAGAALGYVFAGKLLTIWVDFDVADLPSITVVPSDPRWVGAWWPGYIVAGSLALSVFVALLMYPRELPCAAQVRAERVSQTHDDGSAVIANQRGFGSSIQDLPTSLKLLVTNPAFVCVTLSGCVISIFVAGFATFLPKLIQNQFGLTSERAAFSGGLVTVAGGAGGQLLGGVIASCANLKVQGLLRLSIGLCLASMVGSFVFFANCDNAKMAGVNVPYGNGSLELLDASLLAQCNGECSCSTQSYEPVCGNDGIQYFSSCYAGCQVVKVTHDVKWFANCTCVAPLNGSSAASSGICPVDCNVIYWFLPVLFVVILLVFTLCIPALTITLRCVPEQQRTLGVGVQWVLLRFLGFFPGPIIFGCVFDSTCVLWQYTCSERGSCWVYDNAQLSVRVFLTTITSTCVATVLCILALKLYKPPPDEDVLQNETELSVDYGSGWKDEPTIASQEIQNGVTPFK